MAFEYEAKVNTSEINRLLREISRGSEEAGRQLEAALGGEVRKRIVLRTVSDDTGARRLVAIEQERLTKVQQINNELRKYREIERGSATSLRQQLNQARQQRDQIAKFNAQSGSLTMGTAQINERWKAQNAQVRELERNLARVDGSPFWDRFKTQYDVGGLLNFGNGLIQVTQAMQSASIIAGQFQGSINNLISSLANLQQFSLAFKAIGLGTAGGLIALEESNRIAGNLGVSLKTVRQGFQQLTPVVLNSGGSIGDVANITEVLSSRFAAYGISGERARRVTNGIIQAFAKGKLQAEEFTQQIAEADPAFGTDFASALGVSLEELTKKIKAGQVTSKEIIKAFANQNSSLSKSSLLYGKLGITATDAFNALEKGVDNGGVTLDQFQAKVDTINQLSLERFSSALTPVLLQFSRLSAGATDFFASLTKSSVLSALSLNLAGIVGAAGGVVKVFVDMAGGALAVLKPVAMLAEALLKIPGAAELVGLAVVTKMLSPLLALKKSMVESAIQAGGFRARVAAAFTSFGALTETLTAYGNASRKADSSTSALLGRQSRLAGISKSAEDRLAVLTARLEALRATQARFTKGDGLTTLPTPQSTRDANTQEIASVENRIARYRDILASLVVAQDATNEKLKSFTSLLAQQVGPINKVGFVARASFGALSATFASAARGAQALLGAIGPLGVALVAIQTAISAYQSVNASSNAITEESKKRVEALNQATKELGGSTATTKESITGLGLVFAEFGLLVDGAVRAVSSFFDESAGLVSRLAEAQGISKDNQGLKSFFTEVDRVGKAAAITGATTFGLTQAITKFSKARGGWVAALAAGVGLLVALAASGNDARVKTAELTKEIEATTVAAEREAGAVAALARETIKLANANKQAREAQAAGTGDGPTTENLTKVTSQYRVVLDATNALQKRYESLIRDQKAYNDEANKFKGARIASEINRINKEIAKNANAPTSGALGSKEYEKSVQDRITKERQLQAERVRLEKELAQNPVGKGDSAKYEELRRNYEIVSGAVDRVGAALKESKRNVDELAKAGGFPSFVDSKDARNVTNLNESIKSLRQSIADTDPQKQAKDWAQYNQELAKATNELNALQDATEAYQALGGAVTLADGIRAGRYVESITNLERVVKGLEGYTANIDIKSPDLMWAIKSLEVAKARLNELEDRKLKIKIEVNKEQARGGSLEVATQLVQDLEKRKASLRIDSPDLPGVIWDLMHAKELVKDINGAQAEITLDLIEAKGRQSGGLTLSQLDDYISSLKDQSITMRIGTEGLNEWLGALQRFESVVDFFKKTPLDLRLDEAKLQESLAGSKITVGTDPGPLRDALALINQTNSEVNQSFLQAVNLAAGFADAASSGLISQQAAAEGLTSTAEQFNSNLQKGAATLIDAARKTRTDLTDAVNSLLSLQVSNLRFLGRADRASALANLNNRAAEAVRAGFVLPTTDASGRPLDQEGLIREKAALVDFYNQTVKAEKKISEMQTGLSMMEEAATKLKDSGVSEVFDRIGESIGVLGAGTAIAVDNVFSIAEYMQNAQASAEGIASAIKALNGLVVTVSVVGNKGLWTGGTALAGQEYQINELGQEGFLNRFGRLSPINRPRNAFWRPPSTGTVIPAHIMAGLSVPSGGVETGVRPVSVQGSNGLQRVVDALRSSIAAPRESDHSLQQLASVQAFQAREIGRLSRAVDRFADKDWNLGIQVRATGNTAYLQAVNRKM